MMNDSTSFLPFHDDEHAAQVLAGVSAGRPLDHRAPIRPFMPDQHRAFFGLLSYVFTSTPDADGWPMASTLTGPPGFVTSPDPTTLRLQALPQGNDPAAPGFAAGAQIGLLGLDLATRRRNRANGRIVARDDGPNVPGLTVQITQSFGNCPQYIQTRTPVAREVPATSLETLVALDDAARTTIAASDTFFVASRARHALGAAGGLDISHRGGRPGFVEARGDVLAIPDFRGNRFFNTLGNLLGDPRAGLLFVDFDSGDLLQLQGRVEIDWQPGPSAPRGAERVWRVFVERAWRRRGALPLAWHFGAFAPTSLSTGTWLPKERLTAERPPSP